jgi:MFS family permease
VLLTLAAGQFLMTLDSSVMNVSIATVAKDVGTTVTGIQGAITAYTLVMAALMITGAKIGALSVRSRSAASSTAVAPSRRRSRRASPCCSSAGPSWRGSAPR